MAMIPRPKWRMQAKPFRSPIVGAAAVLLMLVGCGGGDDNGGSPTTPEPPDPGDLSAVAGSWVADSILVSPKANPSISREIVSEDDVLFTLRIEMSGSYQAALTAFGQQSQESGTVRVQGDRLLFTVRSPVQGSSEGRFMRAGSRLILEGDLMLDFNRDGIVDDLDTRFVLSPG